MCGDTVTCKDCHRGVQPPPRIDGMDEPSGWSGGGFLRWRSARDFSGPVLTTTSVGEPNELPPWSPIPSCPGCAPALFGSTVNTAWCTLVPVGLQSRSHAGAGAPRIRIRPDVGVLRRGELDSCSILNNGPRGLALIAVIVGRAAPRDPALGATMLRGFGSKSHSRPALRAHPAPLLSRLLSAGVGCVAAVLAQLLAAALPDVAYGFTPHGPVPGFRYDGSVHTV